MDTKKASAAQKRRETKARKLSSSTAKAVAAYAFRNGPVEDMHSAGQLSQGDMKTLNKFAVDRLAEVFYLMFMDRLDDLDDMLAFSRRCVSGWDDASLDQLDKNIASGRIYNNL